MKTLDFKIAFKYPFNRATGMWNILWALLPIVGWFALGGYHLRIIQGFSKGEFKQLPTMKFGSDLKFGFFMFLKAIPFMVAYMVALGGFAKIVEISGIYEGLIGLVSTLVGVFVLPILAINFMNKETIESFFEFKVVKSVLNNLGDYIVMLLKSILLGIIFVIMWIVLVGIPAGSFTKNIFLADFYMRRVK